MINWPKLATGYAVLLVAFMAVEYTALRWVLPTSFWLEYRSVEQFGFAPTGGPVRFESAIDRWRATDMIYQDTLFCNLGKGKFEIFSSQVENFSNAEPRSSSEPAGWWYTAAVPKVQATCYLRSVPKLRLRYGIVRPLEPIISKPFEIGELQ